MLRFGSQSIAICSFALLPLCTISQLQAADFSDPTWPCIQRKVPNLSMGQMWAGPFPAEDERVSEEGEQLSSVLAVRRTSMDDAEVMIGDYAADISANRNNELALLFKATFERIDLERSEIINGIARYAGKQSGLADHVDALQQQVAGLEAKDEKSFDEWDKLEELQDQLVWETRIYRERAQSLTYVCETPVLLEKRAFSIARAIMNHLE